MEDEFWTLKLEQGCHGILGKSFSRRESQAGWDETYAGGKAIEYKEEV